MQMKVQIAEQSERETFAKKPRAFSGTAVHLSEVFAAITKARCQAGSAHGAAVFLHKMPPYEPRNYTLHEVLLWVGVSLPKFQ